MSKITAYNHTPPHKRAHIPSKEEAGMEGQQLSTVHYPLNPVTHRGQDPELWWLDKYGKDDREETLDLAVQSVYRHEHISPQLLIDQLVKVKDGGGAQASIWDTFGNTLKMDELDKVADYYKHSADWQNRLIQGDSLLVMTSLLEREGMAGKVQTIYIDPPYGIKYGSNWQLRLNNRDVKDGSDDALSGEPEMIKAFRDTWELGIHSYLSYLRDRLLIAKELLTESGSCFVQISDENVHLVRCLMDEVFGSENFVGLIAFSKTSGFSTNNLASVADYIVWYGKNSETVKYHQLFKIKNAGDEGASKYKPLENYKNIPNNIIKKFGASRLATSDQLTSQGASSTNQQFEFEGRIYTPPKGMHWKTTVAGLERLAQEGRVFLEGSLPRFIRLLDDYPVYPINNIWNDIGGIQNRDEGKVYVVQTAAEAIKRCILMTTDPGDLVLDPTCGSGTTAYVAEQWGRRWITIDTSRIALNIAKTRLMTATFPYYYLHADVLVEKEEKGGKIKKKILENPNAEERGHVEHGFVYEEVPHITLKSLANDEPAETETLYDKPYVDKSRIRVAGPFTVETLQNFEPMAVDSGQGLVDSGEQLTTNHTSLTTKNSLTTDHYSLFRDTIFTRLQSSGINNGDKTQHARFLRVEPLPGGVYLHGQGFYLRDSPSFGGGRGEAPAGASAPLSDRAGEALAYIHLGPKFGTVSKEAVNEAIKECRARGGADWLIIMGFSFESNIESGTTQTTSLGSFRVTKCRLHDDFLQEGLKKKPAANSGSFVTIGEPDISVDSDEWLVDSAGNLLCRYGIFKKLSGANSLAEVNGLKSADIQAYVQLSQRRDIWIDFADAQSDSEHSSQHRRGAGKEHHGGISSVSRNRERVFSGIGDFDTAISALGISEPKRFRNVVEQLLRNQQNAAWPNQVSAQVAGSGQGIVDSGQATNHYPLISNHPLTTKHYSLITIQGLDIYDPIRDDVQARNVSDIAYWMLDDDYDGSNFMVRQVFFCGGDKDEFDDFKKGISVLAKESAKAKVQRLLKIELDEEAFDRLYGYVSHPIEVRKGRKVAVRVISQFGEESTKVVTL